MTKADKLNHIVILRVLAIILVVLGHATRDIHRPNLHMYSPFHTPFLEIALKKYIYSFHMPLFFWISGYIFYFVNLEKIKGTSIFHEIKKKFERLVIPLYATSFLILMPTVILFGRPHGPILHMAKTFLLCQNNDHLWFLKALFIIFLFVIPIHRYFNKSLLNIFILLILFVISYKNDILPRIIWYSSKYIPFFYIGYLSRRFKYFFKESNSFLLFVIFFLSHLILFAKSRLLNNNNIYISSDSSWYILAILGIYYMYYLSIQIVKLNLSDKLWKCIYYIDKSSYFIYLFHVSILYIVLYIYSFSPKSNALYRLIPSFVFGIILSAIFYHFFSFSRIFCFLFSIPYSKHTT